jgi:signal peptidase I
MVDKDEERVVLERGLAEHEWHAPKNVPPRPREPWYRSLRPRLSDWSAYQYARQLRIGVVVLFVAGIALAILFGSLRGFKAEGVSMEPSLHNGDHVIVNRLAYAHIDFGLIRWLPVIDIDARWSKPDRGDVLVFHSPIENRELVKRVIGLPGETVTINQNGVIIDGVPFPEPYAIGETTCLDICSWTIPDDSYFVLGDNRQNSLDSRGGWFVPIDNIAGKKLITY